MEASWLVKAVVSRKKQGGVKTTWYYRKPQRYYIKQTTGVQCGINSQSMPKDIKEILSLSVHVWSKKKFSIQKTTCKDKFYRSIIYIEEEVIKLCVWDRHVQLNVCCVFNSTGHWTKFLWSGGMDARLRTSTRSCLYFVTVCPISYCSALE